jgi:hypothetical protein
MADTDTALLAAAQSVKADDAALGEAWHYVTEAIRVGWIDRPELVELLSTIERGQDYLNNELGLEYRAKRFVVSFIQSEVAVPPEDFCALVREALGQGGHPGTITIMEDERVIAVRKVDEVPEEARFADTPAGPKPVVKVVMRMMSETTREIVEYGPNDERLRSTIQTKG